MTGVEFLEQVARQREQALSRQHALDSQDQQFAPRVPDSLRDEVIWAQLLAKLDFQTGKWWLFDSEIEQWQELGFHHIDDMLASIGIDDRFEQNCVKRLFEDRDDLCNRIQHDPEKREEQQLKDRRDREREDRRLIERRKGEQRGDQRDFWE